MSHGTKSAKGLSVGAVDKESLRQFNYYGQTKLENIDEHDIIGLEREIDYIIRNSHVGGDIPSRGMTANGDPNIVDINSAGGAFLPKKRNKTAGPSHNPRVGKKKALKNKKLSMKPPAGMNLQINRTNLPEMGQSHESLEPKPYADI